MTLLEYSFFRYALLGALLAGILCGIVGTYVVTRRLVSVTGGITHASFGGIGIGVLLGISPIFSAMIFAVASALGVQWLSQRGNVREDSAVMMFWTLGMSVGILCCFSAPGFMPDLPSFLFGSILTITLSDLGVMAGVTLLATVAITLFYRPILSVAFDADFARSQRLPVAFIEYFMMALTAMTIVATLRMVGIVLALSLLTIPQMTANLVTKNYKKLICGSILIGWINCAAGLYLSYIYNVPSGATIILVSIVLYILVKSATTIYHPKYETT